ncbi:MAG: hypothetical protein QXR38_03280, partial [Nitrososphaerales archaeon]
MEFQTSSKKTLIILIALALKTVLSIYSVWSYEFINMAKASTVRFFVGNSSSIPWIHFNHLIYEFWRWLIPNSPINLEEWLILLSTFPNSFDAYLLVFLFKLPILLADIACGFLIYFLAKEFMDHKKALLASI